MTEEDSEQMKRFGITAEQKTVYTYRGYKYDHLRDALNYARLEAGRRPPDAAKAAGADPEA